MFNFLEIQTLALLFLLPFSSLVILIHFKWISLYSKTTKNLPPSPLGLPIIGNLHQLGSAPHLSLKALAHKHGSLMLIHLGSVPVVIASSASAAQEIMKTNDLIFSNRPNSSFLNILTYGAKTVGFAPYGEYWRQSKSIYVLHLLTARKVQSFRNIREEETALMIDRIKSTNSDGVIDLSKLLMSLTNDVICRVTLGRKFANQKFKNLLVELVTLLGVFSVGNYIPSLSWVDWLYGLEARANKVAKELDDFIEGVIEDHVFRKKGTNGVQDVVDILIDLQREQASSDSPLHRDAIKALTLEMFAAGTDTTFTSLEWAISELIRHPRVMKKLQQEVTEIAQGKSEISEEDFECIQHPYLEAVIKETMRLHTPLPLLFPRESTQDVKVLGYNVAGGTLVFINAYTIARDPAIWEEPEEFRPERFLNTSIDYKGFDSELVPFGAGRRKCPGIQFAIAVYQLALANLVYKFDFKLPNNAKVEELDMSEAIGLTVRKKKPLLLMPVARF